MSDLHPIDPVDPAVERRIAEAFGALLTAEVPATAPRPQQAPRPAGTDRRARRRRLQLAGGGLLAVAAAVVIALVVGTEVDEARTRPTTPPGTERPTTSAPSTTPPPTASDTPTTTSSTATTSGPEIAPGVAEVSSAFTDATRPTRSDVVAVPGGYEGADLDAGTIRFWRWDGSAWAVDGTSSYPADVRGDAQVTYTATVDAAALLTGMRHATFVLRGAFTGDSTGNVIAYADGDHGWGVVKAGADSNLHPSGEPLGADLVGLMFEGGLVDGLLETIDCDLTTGAPMAECGLPANQIVKDWRWDGTQFVLDH